MRELNPTVVKAIDQMAKKKGMSREAFLRAHLSTLVATEELNEQKEMMLELKKDILTTLNRTNNMVEDIHVSLFADADEI